MRRVPAVVAMLLVVFGLAVPSRAAITEGILLRGNRTAYVDLFVYVNTTINASDLRIQRGGSFAGFFMSPAPANRDTVGALVMPRAGATGGGTSGTARLGESWEVQAGKYRVFLLTDGPAEVFIPIEGQGFRAYRPSHRAPLSVRRLDFDVAAGSSGSVARVPMAPRSRSLVVALGVATSSSLTAVDQLDACVTTDASCATTYALTVRGPAATAWTYGVSLVPPGRYTGMLDLTRVGGVDAGSHVAGAVLILTIGIQT